MLPSKPVDFFNGLVDATAFKAVHVISASEDVKVDLRTSEISKNIQCTTYLKNPYFVPSKAGPAETYADSFGFLQYLSI